MFAAMYLILTGYYEEKIEALTQKRRVKYEYVPAPTFDMMIKESNEIVNY
mgnify:FL=1